VVFLYFLARPDWRKGHGFPDFFPAGNRSGLDGDSQQGNVECGIGLRIRLMKRVEKVYHLIGYNGVLQSSLVLGRTVGVGCRYVA